MQTLPPLDCLRFFAAAARHQNFVRAAEELQVTPAAVAHRVRMLEKHLEAPLFDRRPRGVRLNRRGPPITRRSGASSPTSTRPPGATATGGGSAAASVPPVPRDKRTCLQRVKCAMT